MFRFAVIASRIIFRVKIQNEHDYSQNYGNLLKSITKAHSPDSVYTINIKRVFSVKEQWRGIELNPL